MTSVKNYPPRIDRTILDICDCISKFKDEFQETNIPINDDNVTFHRFCGKLEYVLQLDLKEKTSLLGISKDYWDYFCKCLATKNKIHDGLRFVKGVSELKTSLGRGRAFIRFCLMHQCLADTLQQCIDNTKETKSWYGEKALLVNSIQTSCLLSHLYELNEVQFDLSSQGHDLDVAWPSFARKFFDAPCWRPPSRTYSLSSLVSDISVQSEFVASNLSPSKEAACSASLITKEGDVGKEKEELMIKNLMVANASISNSSELEEVDKINKEMTMGNELKLQMEEIMKQFEIKEQNWAAKISDLQSRLDQSKQKLGECVVLIKDRSSEKTVNQSQCCDFLAYCNKILMVTNETVDFMKSELNSDFKSDKEGQSSGKDIGPLFREIDNQIKLLEKKAGTLDGNVSAKEHASLMNRLKASLEKLNNIGYEKLLKINKELKRLREKTIDQIDVNNKLDKQLNILTNENEDLKYSLEKSTIEVKDCNKKLEKQEKRREGLEEQVDALKDGLAAAKKMLELKDEVITHLRKDLTTTKTKLIKNEETVKELECKLKAAEEDKDYENANLIGTAQTHLDLQKQVEKGQRESEESRVSIIELNEKLKSSSLLLSQQDEEVTNLKQRLDVSLKENERLSQQMNFLWNLLQQAERRVVYLDCRQMSNNQTDQNVHPQENLVNISEVNDFFDSVNPVLDTVTESSDTLPDPPIIATASRTLSRLHSLIDEKLELQQELESTKEIASSLLNKMAEQEEKLSTVTMELTETQSLMAKLRAAFQKLQTSEAIMRYELKEKRTMLDKLKGQLHNSHAQWEQIRQKNNESEVEWQSLREEFANRRKQGSEESGFSDENGKSEEIEVELDPILSPCSPPQFPSQLPDLPMANDTSKEGESEPVIAVVEDTLVTSAEENVSEENVIVAETLTTDAVKKNVSEGNVIVAETLTTDTVGTSKLEEVSEENLSEASTSSIEVQASEEAGASDVVRSSADERRRRLDRMEEQCKCLYNKLSANYVNTSALHSRVASLHDYYCGGSSETDSQDADESPETLPTVSSESVAPDLNTAKTLNTGAEGPENQMPIVEALLTDLVDFGVQSAETSSTTTLPNDLTVLDVEISDDESHTNAPIKPTPFMLAQALPKRIEKLMKEKEELKQEISKLQKEKEEGVCTENNLKAQLESVNLEKEELSKKLQTAEKQRQEVAVKGLELKRRADFIMKKEKEQNDLRIQQIQITKDSLQRKMDDAEAELKEQSELIKNLEESLCKSQAELASTKTSQEQQIEALKFQLCTEALKHEKAFKGHSEQEMVINSMREQMNQQELVISSLEKELKQIHDGREQEKKNQMITLEELNIALTTRDEECLNLSESLKEVSKRLDEETVKNNQYQNELEKVRGSSEETIRNLEKEVSELQSDSHELKKYIIKLIREKDLLWKQSDKLCHRQKVQAADRWMNDDEVSKCIACKSEFSFTVRKHHCRLCGRIFCYNCCNNWVMTTASSSFLSNDSEDETTGAEACNNGSSSLTRTESTDLQSINSEVTEKNSQKRKDSVLDSLPTSNQDDDDEEFHIISDEEISRSLSGSNPYSSSASDSLESSVMLSTRKTFEDIPSDRETAEAKEIWISAGKKYLFPVYLEENSSTLFWNFSSEPKSIAFSLTYSEKEGGVEQNLIPTTKCNGHLHPIQGKLLVKRQGLYTLIFDNSFSRFIAKKVTLTVWLKPPQKEESNGENSS